MGEVTIHHGDCLGIMAGLPSASIDAVVTDPPYFLPAVHYNTRRRFPRSLSDLSMLEHFYGSVFKEFERLLKPSGVLYAFCDGQSYPVFFSVSYRHFDKLRPLIWDKVVSFNGFSWRKQHELILFAEMPDAKPVKTGDGDILRYRAVKIDDRSHPAQKPVDLLRSLIRKSCQPGSVILDPFAGSGATGAAAVAEGCSAILIEREAEYVAHAKARLARMQAAGPSAVPSHSGLFADEAAA